MEHQDEKDLGRCQDETPGIDPVAQRVAFLVHLLTVPWGVPPCVGPHELTELSRVHQGVMARIRTGEGCGFGLLIWE